MQVNAELIRLEREKRAWSQSHLAGVCGLGLRTIQRIEATGSASFESAAAIAAAFLLTVSELKAMQGETMQLPASEAAMRRPSLAVAASLVAFGFALGACLTYTLDLTAFWAAQPGPVAAGSGADRDAAYVAAAFAQKPVIRHAITVDEMQKQGLVTIAEVVEYLKVFDGQAPGQGLHFAVLE